ncbi:Wzz/FepE/Etk N-terminal domain-containing protein [Nonomuraea sp. NPDC050536]|uniref:Wzz/FepE/Etk N-terminal domain-containing protein n=1 Tax=Nonomuraea sp. NPDC050536 TaxID=3364366 RepID=UPI0037C50330
MKYARRAAVLARRWWLQVSAVLLGVLAGLLFSALRQPVYTAEAYVVAVADDKVNIDQATNFAQAYARIVTQPAIVGTQNLSRLQRAIRVASSPDAPVILLSATGPQPGPAAAQANEVAEALITYANDHKGDTGVRLASLSTASPPTEPSSSSLAVNLAVGCAAGVLLGGLGYLVSPVLPARRTRCRCGATREYPDESAPKQKVQA